MTMRDRQEQLDQVQYLLGHGRVRTALEQINQISHYRFTAIYRIAEDSLVNLLVVDRQSEMPPRLVPIPVNDSYCVYVRDHLDAFLVQDADQDRRVVDHPKRPVVKAYCGVPLKKPDGSIFGTICHFDFDPVTDDPDAQWWLEQVAGFFDPSVASNALVHGARTAMDALEAMLDLLVETSDDLQSATEAFDDFAAPVQARLQQLPAEAALAMQARMAALHAPVPERFARSRAGGAGQH